MTRGALWVGGIAVLCAAVALAVVLSRPSSTRDKLADWVNVDDCASVDNQSWAPDRFYEVPVGFARLAVERAVIACNEAGPSTYYFRFRTPAAMRAALVAYRSMRRHRLCRLNDAVFTTDGLDPGWPSSFCARLHGTLLPT